jgi:hypothetical protein
MKDLRTSARLVSRRMERKPHRYKLDRMIQCENKVVRNQIISRSYKLKRLNYFTRKMESY